MDYEYYKRWNSWYPPKIKGKFSRKIGKSSHGKKGSAPFKESNIISEKKKDASKKPPFLPAAVQLPRTGEKRDVQASYSVGERLFYENNG